MNNISMYNGSTDTKGIIVDYKRLLRGISEGRWKESIQNLLLLFKDSREDSYTKAKKLLPSVTFAGTFSKREAAAIIDYSGMIILDVDGLNEDQIAQYKKAFNKEPIIHACFISPSGVGLKILVKVDCAPEDHLKAFLQLEEYFKNTYAITLDKSGKDVSRLCYVSYDPDMIWNDESTVLSVDTTRQINTVAQFDKRPEKFKGHVISKDAGYFFKVCKAWTERHHQYEQGNRNNYIHVLACNMNRAGVHVNDAILMIYNEFSDLPTAEIEQAIKSAYKRTSEHNTIDIYNIDANDLPEHNEDFSQAEDTVYSDTLELLRSGIKKNLVAKLMKCFGTSFLGLEEKEVTTLMNQAFVKMKQESDSDFKTESAEDSLMKAIEEFQDEGGVSTNVEEFDETLGGGLMPGCLYGAIGDGGTYKSIFAHCTGADQSKVGGMVLYLNGEMSRLQLMDRVISKELGTDLINGLKDKSITQENIPTLIEKLKPILKDNFHIVDSSGWNQEDIITIVTSLESKYNKKVRLVIVDGLSQMEDTKKDEIKSAIFNSGELKEVAKKVNAAVLVLVHVSGGLGKHVRDTSKFVRGGAKVVNNMDAMFCTSLLIDKDASNLETGDIKYMQGIFYLRLIDKRGSGLILDKIVRVNRPLEFEPQQVDPQAMEVSLK